MKIRVVALPAFRNKDSNPYNYLLYTSLEKLGVHVDEFSIIRVIFNKYDIFHVHWPELSINVKNSLLAFFRGFIFLLLVFVAKIRGMKIVWTVHNLRSHEKWHPYIERLFWKVFLRLVDGYICLSTISIKLLLREHPELRTISGFVVPHGHYQGVYPNSIPRDLARRKLSIPQDSRVFLFFGQIRRYKNIIPLIKSFKHLKSPDYILIIAGKPVDVEYLNEVLEISRDDSRILIYPLYIPPDQIQVYMNASDLVVLPYQDILNSGSSMLALSFNKPILVPATGTMLELQRMFGSKWVMVYLNDLTPRDLEKGIKYAIWIRRAPLVLYGTLFDWDYIAIKTLNVYKALISNSGGSSNG